MSVEAAGFQRVVRQPAVEAGATTTTDFSLRVGDADREVRNLATALFVHCGRLFHVFGRGGCGADQQCRGRAWRTAVQWRKISFGNRSRNGKIATARLLTVTQTCKRQQRHLLGYLTDAVRCYRHQAEAPSLLTHRP